MRYRAIGGLAVSALLTTAPLGASSAADMPLKAPYAPSPPQFSWTGCYGGAAIGWGWGEQDPEDQSITYIHHVGPPVSFSSTNSIDPTSGGLFGGQVGCDYQLANFVVGVSGSISGTDIDGVANDANIYTGSTKESGTISEKTDWLASATGRLGFAGWNPQMLSYVRGGVAWAHDTWDLGNSFLLWPTNTPNDTAGGWTIGGGFEWAFTPSLSAFIEYDFYSLGTVNVISFTQRPYASATCFGAASCTLSAQETINAVKLGINYRFR